MVARRPLYAILLGPRHRIDHFLAVLIVVVSLTGVLGHRFYNQPKLNLGTIAPQTIKAPSSARLEDTKTTEDNRQTTRTVFVRVLMIDLAVNQQIQRDLKQALAQGNELRQIVGPFPFVETWVLSTSIQRYLRNCPDSEWQAMLNAVLEPGEAKKTAVVNPAFAKAIGELQTYKGDSPQKLSALIAKMSQARQQYTQALAISADLVVSDGSLFDASLLDLSAQDWGKTQKGLIYSANRILSQGISPGLPSSILQQAVSLQVRLLVPTDAEPLATKLLLTFLKPNLKEDVEQTKLQAEKAASAVEPVMLEVRQGEVIVRAGEVITQPDFVLLDHFGLSRREINWLGLIQLGVTVVGAVGVFGLVERRIHSKLRQRDRLLVLLLALSTPLLAMVNPYTNLPAIGLLLGSFYGFPLSVTVVGLLTMLLPVSLDIGAQHLLAGAVGGMLGGWMAGRLRSREELALLGCAVGLTEGVVYLFVNFILGATSPSSFWYSVVPAALFGLSGLAWSIVALGLSPYLEQLFDLVTPIRLAELASPNRPLLKQLATQAPGTCQHTMFVANLAEAAAKVLGCNVELVRAGTLYHDIGKMHDPLAFIENQMGGPNKHDEINDPWISAEIIKKHVSAGLIMARKHRLPTAIQAFIPEHQGTILIAYFYHQAVLAAVNPNQQVQESDFRYDGPIPQSRETGIVMLADACEAALRSLKDACPEEALAMVNKILRGRWQDNQLVDSGLKREEMSQIAEIFLQVWLQFHHKRIAYPQMAVKS